MDHFCLGQMWSNYQECTVYRNVCVTDEINNDDLNNKNAWEPLFGHQPGKNKQLESLVTLYTACMVSCALECLI